MKFARLLFTAISLFLLLDTAQAEWTADETAKALNDEWAQIFYAHPTNSQAEKFKALLPRIREFKSRYPGRAEPHILEAVTLCTLVAAEWSFDALSLLDDARKLLLKAIAIDPRAMDATGLIALGNLYFRLPGWPISFGDDEQALRYLEEAVKLSPEAVDANHFLGDYWLDKKNYDRALPLLEKADKSPIRPNHVLSDTHTRGENRKALDSARKRESRQDGFFDQLLPSM